jgi:hypothetical protein
MITVLSSQYQTKDWRKDQEWYKGGKHNECENYQKQLINKITKLDIIKTKLRINMESYELEYETSPLKKLNGFEYTEDFDGIIKNKDLKIFLNLKFICDQGGAQTRSLREVYIFIKAQLNVLKNNNLKTYFVNILDGDTSFKHIDKFNYLINNFEDKDITKYIFIGDMNSFQNFWKKLNK